MLISPSSFCCESMALNASIVYASTRSHVNLWRPIDMHPVSSAPEGFIFSTAQTDRNPRVIVDLGIPVDARDVEIAIWNRDLYHCRERVLGLKVFTSKDLRYWREHEICHGHPFVHESVPLNLQLQQGEKFMSLEIPGASNHFHLGGINVSPNCSYGMKLLYEYDFYRFAHRVGGLSNSQRLQDIFAIFNCGFTGDFFLEFGVADGVSLSNTLLLEVLGWQGIAGEALSSYCSKAKDARSCIVVEGALSSVSGKKIEFFESGLLSSSVTAADTDMYGKVRSKGNLVHCFTRRIDEVLQEHEAPSRIGYLSLDVEGAELEVMETFPFDRYQLKCATIEHNYTPREAAIDAVMSSNGFSRVLNDISGHDAYYVHKTCQKIDWEKKGLFELKSHPAAVQLLALCRGEINVQPAS